MEFFDTVRRRHSVRDFMDMPVEKDKIRRILEAANMAPSAQNLQKYEIFLMDDRSKIAELEGIAVQEFVSDAPVVLVFCIQKNKETKWDSGRKIPYEFPIEDATIAASYAQLAATALGLGSVWVAGFDSKKLLKLIGNPKHVMPITMITIGYPVEKPTSKPRRKLDDIVHNV